MHSATDQIETDPRHTSSSPTPAGLRYEIKLVCGPGLLSQARSWIRLHPAGFVVSYPPRRVNSLYLDTLGMRNFSDNLAGLDDRRKLRLRWYGPLTPHIQPQLELKHRHSDVGAKRQYLLPCRLDLANTWATILATIRRNIEPAWNRCLQTMDQPALLNSYQREYYVTADNVVRVTLDSDLVAYDQRLTVRPNLSARLPLVRNVVIEVKAAQTQLERLEQIVASFPVLRGRNSKYVNGIAATLA